EKMFFAPHFVDNEWFKQKAETLKAEILKSEMGRTEVQKAESRNQPGEVEQPVRGEAEILKKQKAETRRQWGAKEEELVVLFVGKFQPIKRPQDLLHAISAFKSQLSALNPMAVFVGAGELEGELREL